MIRNELSTNHPWLDQSQISDADIALFWDIEDRDPDDVAFEIAHDEFATANDTPMDESMLKHVIPFGEDISFVEDALPYLYAFYLFSLCEQRGIKEQAEDIAPITFEQVVDFVRATHGPYERQKGRCQTTLRSLWEILKTRGVA